MEIDWQIDVEARVVLMRYRGPLDFECWAETVRAIFADPQYRPGMHFVAELDGSPPPDTAYILASIAFVEEHAAQFGACRWANVTKAPAHYGMTRVAQARAHHLPSTVGVFASVSEALEWLREGADPGPTAEGPVGWMRRPKGREGSDGEAGPPRAG